MGVFRDHFHWRTLATSPIGVTSILLATSGGFRLGEWFGTAAFFLALAAGTLIIRIVLAAVSSTDRLASRVLFATVCSLGIIAVAAAMFAVSMPKARVEAVSTPAAPKPERQVSTPPRRDEVPPIPAKPQPQPDATKSAERPIRRSAEAPALAKPEPIRVFVDCRMGTLPGKVPDSGRIYVLTPLEMPEANGGGYLAEYFGTPGSDRGSGKLPAWAYRCDLTNYSADILIDVAVDIVYTLVRPVPVPEQKNAFKQGEVTLQRRWPISIAKIDSGPREPFTFYVHNCCLDRFVYVKFPATAKARRGSELVDIAIEQSARNLFEPLSPSSFNP